MLDSEGRYFPDYAEVLRRFLVERDVHLCLVHPRSPHYRDLKIRAQIIERRLGPLAQPDMQALISRLLREAHIEPDPDATSRLAEVAGGYPPAAYYLVSQIEDYGLDVILGDPARILDFQSGSFSRFLRDLHLPPVEREVLIYLSSETHLSLAGIAAATGHGVERTARAIKLLVDLNLVERLDNEYAVAGPIQTTVLRTEDGLGRKWYEGAFSRLEAEYWSDERSLPPISVVDATLRAGFRLGRNATRQYGSLVRPSLLIHAAQEMYHRREYDQALEYLQRAEQLGGATPQLLEIRIKSLAQLGRIDRARKELARYRESGERRQWYLAGFIERKAGRHDRACSSFQQGYARKDRTVSLLRDYADSLLRTDALDEAAAIAREALDRHPANIYVLDLAARIEIAGGTRDDAEAALNALEAADIDGRFHLHRRAAYLLQRRGGAEAAKRAVQLAEEATRRRDAPLGAYVVLGRALIATRDWQGFEAVKAEIRKRRKSDHRNVLRSLDF
ncbi:MAG TPA: hypothetical protein VER55_15215, partial [Ardenticatenaceae bacterium]|nr:hypothetical protein [Ardenticatenaceae bacterium]